MHQQRILVVDDDTDLREVIRLWLVKANVEVLVASNGDEAFQLLANAESVDLILTDFMMPEMNGIELVRQVKANSKLYGVPVVVMSNNADPEFRQRAIEMGASAYLAKSSGARALAEKAIEIVAGRLPGTSPGQGQIGVSGQVLAMQQSLLALIRVTSQIDGLPPAAKSALISAEKLAESLFASVPAA